ncbi:hypothetical protein ACWDF1_01295 [Streptomyces coelicoflavus]|uniref:hypothetical protein n=1 Tax=Streptomyces coelicoflavus TaxID=285562 RepID=UPI00024761F6|nr:hypothetical protein SMCF_7451 [Streptomyces coelicoflavus ZG0656]KPC85296.1 hypothetical protein ADL35_13715 [Streptomyces sp. NRRL WC-3753]MZE48921.1 hypothetical protein [Streptomyces sp. SID5477]
MPDQKESGEKLAGRLYATLRVLKFIADPGSGVKPTVRDEFKDKDSPRQRIQALKLDLFENLVTAVQKGRHAKAMAEVFGAMPSVVPLRQGAIEHNLGERELAEFNAGYRDQLGILKEALPKLLD